MAEIQKPSDTRNEEIRQSDRPTVAKPIADAENQETWHDASKSNRECQKESATHLAMTDEMIAELKAKGLAEKFEIVGLENPSVKDHPGDAVIAGNPFQDAARSVGEAWEGFWHPDREDPIRRCTIWLLFRLFMPQISRSME